MKTSLTLIFMLQISMHWASAAVPDEGVPFLPDPLSGNSHLPQVKTEEIDTGPPASLAQIAPEIRLRMALQRFERIAQMGGWPKIPPGPALRAGDWSPRVALLRTRLRITGELDAHDPAAPEAFDEDVDEAVQIFQENHGLERTGELDPATLSELNLPVAARIATLRSNLERWRNTPRLPEDRYVMVDIPAYQMRIYEHGEPVLVMRAVVGEKEKATPIFSSKITQVTLNPWWSMPRNIAVREALPALRSHPEEFLKNRVEVIDVAKGTRVDPAKVDWRRVTAKNFNYSFRQAPGPDNPLGAIKFSLPNRYSVYLHGTSEEWLFSSSTRSFSHGCVRLEKPAELALYLLKGDEKSATKDKLNEWIRTGKPHTVELSHPIPVFFGYWTAWVDETGALQFRPDIYGRDHPGSSDTSQQTASLAPSAPSSAAE